MKKNIKQSSVRLGFLLLFSIAFLPNSWSQTIKEFYEKGDQAYSQGDFSKAVDWYEKVVEVDPNFAPAYNALGLAHREINTELSEVAWLFKTATDIDPAFASAFDNLGKTYYGMGEHDRAEQSSLKALELSPKMTSAKLTLGWIYLLGKSSPKQAAKYFKEIIEETDLPYAYFGLGMAYFMSGDRSAVLEIVTKLRSLQKEQLAAQLESIVRNSAPQATLAQGGGENSPSQNFIPRSPAYDGYSSSPRSSSVSIPANPAAQQTASSINPNGSGSAGVMKVRLRGKMFGAPKKDDGLASASVGAQTDTSLSNDVSTRQRSAIERIRSLRASAVAQGRGTATVSGQLTGQSQSAPGTPAY